MVVFALNTGVSTATKCIPCNVVFGRSARLPIDALFNHDENHLKDLISPADYALERIFILKDVFDIVKRTCNLTAIKY